jgi:hypothetical protein
MELPKRLGKKTITTKIDGSPLIYEVVDEEVFIAPSNDRKAFCLQRLRFDDGQEVFRISYYMIAERARMRGKWAFGQFAPMMTQEEMNMIFIKVKEKGWI